MILVPTALLVLAAASADPIRVTIPGQPVEVSVVIPGFQPDAEAIDPERMLLSGRTASGCIVSILYEENLPFVSSQDAASRIATGRRVQTFQVGETACCESKAEIRDTIVETTFQAWPTTAAYHFDVHVSFVMSKKDAADAGTFARSDFAALVESFRVEGAPDPAKFAFPPELYAFRDEAATAESDAYGWLTKQCVVRGGDWVPHLYLGMLADENERDSFVVQGFTRAAHLLEDLRARTPKHTRTLMYALERAAAVHIDQKKYDKAIPFCETAVRVPRPEDGPEVQRYREEALFVLACCQARGAQKDAAIATLKLALEARPDFKERAAASDMLESLRGLPAFKELVGG